MVGEEAALSDSEGESENDDEGKKRMEPDEGGVLRLEGGSNDEDLDSVNDLLHWQIEDDEFFSNCNMLRVDEGNKGEENDCPKEYREVKEGKVVMDEAEGKSIPYEPRIRKNSNVQYTVNKLHGKKRLHRTTELVERCRQ